MRPITEVEFPMFLAQAGLGASYSIEISLPLIHPSWIEYIRDLAFMVDQRITRKMLLPEYWMELSTEMDDSGKSLLSEEVTPAGARPFLDTGWEVKSSSYPRLGFTIIVDREERIHIAHAEGLQLDFPIGGRYPAVPKFFLMQTEDEAREPIRAFDQGWKEGHEFDAIYQSDTAALEDEEAKEHEGFIIQSSKGQFENLLKYLTKYPEKMRDMKPRKFEELIYELLLKEGFKADLTPATRDGGRDIIAVTESALGKHLYLIECKRYAEKKRDWCRACSKSLRRCLSAKRDRRNASNNNAFYGARRRIHRFSSTSPIKKRLQ